MISREEIIRNPDSWISTDRLKLDFFDYLAKEFGSPYYLKQKGSDDVCYATYDPESKSFECHKLNDYDRFNLKIEDVECFISLPPLSYKL